MISTEGALIRRLYKTVEEVQQYTSVKHLCLLIRFIAESGVLYLSVTLAHLLVSFGPNPMAVQIIGILVNVIPLSLATCELTSLINRIRPSWALHLIHS